MIFPCLKIDTMYSSDAGAFRILVSSDFRGDLHYSHPDYNPYIERIRRRSNKTLHVIDLLSDSLVFDTICYPTLPGNICFEGRILSKKTRQPVEYALFQLKDQKRIGYSIKHGDYRVCVPKSTDSLLISQKDFKTRAISVRELTFSHKVLIEPLVKDTLDDLKTSYRNSIGLMLNELIRGSVGIDYERFLKYRHSIGLKSSFFLFDGLYFGIPFNYAQAPSFKGIKLSPYYRYYYWRYPSNGAFVEGKLSWGYIDFKEISYRQQNAVDDDYYYRLYSEISRSMGFGVALGWMIKRVQSPVVLSFGIGLQYFPLNVPSTQKDTWNNQSVDLVLDNPYWYVRVPGSVLEFKFMIGGIF